MNKEALFNPELYREVRQPMGRASGLPSWCYTDDAFYGRELETILLKDWIMVGRVEEYPSSGSYQVIERFGRSVILVKDRTNHIRAFLNACRHRGTRLLEGQGECKAINCPYHSWTYSLSGQLTAAPGMDGVEDFSHGDWPLVPIRLELWGGFLFINFDEHAAPLSEQLGSIQDLFSGHRFEEMRMTRKKSFELDCNWKIYIENAMEDYHTPTVHKRSIGLQRTDMESVERGEWSAIHMESSSTIAVLPGENSPLPVIPTLSGRAREGSFFALINPTLFLGVTLDCMWFLETIPISASKSIVNVGSCFPEATIAHPRFAEAVTRYYFRWDKSIPEDNEISVRQQSGLRTLGNHPMGRLSFHEPAVHRFANWILDRVLPVDTVTAATL
jgi:phenylpropionate dioxygenase-like ring-hydroxylating dioxygenase large terminal subunit